MPTNMTTETRREEWFDHYVGMLAEAVAHVGGKTKWGRATKLMAVADGCSLPLAVHTAVWLRRMKSPLSQKLSLRPLPPHLPEKEIGDKADDNDPLDVALARQDIERLAPYRETEKSPRPKRTDPCGVTPDAEAVERLLAWLQNFRRVVVRYERHVENFLGFLHLDCILILLRCCL